MFPEMEFWGSAAVSSKGQVVIPAEAREALHIKEGNRFVVMGSAQAGIISLVKPEAIEKMMTTVQNDLMKMQQSVNEGGHK